jgi:hypothetical protein
LATLIGGRLLSGRNPKVESNPLGTARCLPSRFGHVEPPIRG